MRKGFTIIETMVAVTILIIGVVGPLALAARGISDGLFAQNQLTANLLAQEAIETMVNQRNANITEILKDAPDVTPFQGIIDPTVIVGDENFHVSVDSTTGEINYQEDGCDEDWGCLLTYDTDSGVYRKASGDETGMFYRQIITKLINKRESGSGHDELEVKVTITWNNKNITKRFTTVEYLYGL